MHAIAVPFVDRVYSTLRASSLCRCVTKVELLINSILDVKLISICFTRQV
jgi:hypothetical protein